MRIEKLVISSRYIEGIGEDIPVCSWRNINILSLKAVDSHAEIFTPFNDPIQLIKS